MITPCLIIKLDHVYVDEDDDNLAWAEVGKETFKLVWDGGWTEMDTGGYLCGGSDWQDYRDPNTYLKIEIKDE